MTPSPPPALVQYIREKRCVLFVGSGLSAWAGLPTWRALLTTMVDEVRASGVEDRDLAELQYLLESGKLLEVADFCLEALGRQRYYSLLSRNLRGEGPAIPEPPRIVARLPFAGIVTTNYDKLLERSYAGSFPRAPTHADIAALGPLLFDDAFFILKAHGDIDRPDTIVLTANDYRLLIHRNPAFNAIFSAILLTKAILFVGYSLSDPDFRLLLDRQLTIFDRHVPDRYALMAGVGRIERELLLRTAGIRVLSYEGGHQAVVEFLRALENQLGQAPGVPPATPRALESPPVFLARPPESPTVLHIASQGQALEIVLEIRETSIQSSGVAPEFARVAALMRLARTGDEVRTVAELLSECLPAAMLARLAEVPSGETVGLRISPDLDVLPWEWILIGRDFLVHRNPLFRTPTGITDTARGYPAIRRPARVLVIGDSNSGDGWPLPGAHNEAGAIAAIYAAHPGIVCTSLLGPEASFDAVAAACRSGSFDIIHFAGHAWFDDEPYLSLSGLTKLHSSELRSLLSVRPPAVLFLNAHYSFFMPPGASANAGEGPFGKGTESAPLGHRGFLDAASKAGVGALIGTFSGWLDDEVAHFAGVTFHKKLLNGEPVALALHHTSRAAARRLNSPDPLFYSVSGYGDLKYQPES